MEPQTTETSNNTENKGEILVSMEGMIKSHVSSLDKLQQEYKKHKEMLDDIFTNDATYQTHSEKAKEANKVKAATKTQILKQPQAAQLQEKIKSMKSEISELQSALSDYLQEYERLSGVNEIEGEDGEVREIVSTAKLVKKALRP